jgi:transposase
MPEDRYIHEMPLVVTPPQAKVLDQRFEAARMIYNAALQEGLKRHDLCKQSKDWQKARGLLKASKTTEAKALFRATHDRHGLREYDIRDTAKCRNNAEHLRHLVDSQTANRIAVRAFKSIDEYFYRKRGRPKFKRYGSVNSVESINNIQGIIFREDKVVWNTGRGNKYKMVLPVKFDRKDKHGVEAAALSGDIKQCRLKRDVVNGKKRFYVQLVLEGKPKDRPNTTTKDGTVGLDLGPSTIAWVSDDKAVFKKFCEEIAPISKQKRLIQRKMQRSLRANNPDNYEPDELKKNPNGKAIRKLGKVKKGPKTWVRSARYYELKGELARADRKIRETRDKLQGQLANEILRQGSLVRTEKLSYKSFQRNFGRSVRDRAPGMFIEKLRRRADHLGATVEEINTRLTRLSQTCHGCGQIKKKSLSEREHICECGVSAHRDLYSAWLARYVDENVLDVSQCQKHWASAEPRLGRVTSSA